MGVSFFYDTENKSYLDKILPKLLLFRKKQNLISPVEIKLLNVEII